MVVKARSFFSGRRCRKARCDLESVDTTVRFPNSALAQGACNCHLLVDSRSWEANLSRRPRNPALMLGFSVPKIELTSPDDSAFRPRAQPNQGSFTEEIAGWTLSNRCLLQLLLPGMSQSPIETDSACADRVIAEGSECDGFNGAVRLAECSSEPQAAWAPPSAPGSRTIAFAAYS